MAIDLATGDQSRPHPPWCVL